LVDVPRLGHDGVAVLDGGLAVRAEGGRRERHAGAGAASVKATASELVRDLDAMPRNLASARAVLDARSRALAGTEPGRAPACAPSHPRQPNLPYDLASSARGTLKAPDELRAALQGAGSISPAPS